MKSDVNNKKIHEERSYLYLAIILPLGLVLMIILSFYWTYEPEFGTFRAWAIGISDVGFSNFYI